ncbi:MAG: transketolase [Candidatus Diapherotrites archaeon]|nr:transketolase [Candidatus Diapherotrites archaeon]
MNDSEISSLKEKAYLLRQDILKMTTKAASGHPTTSMSCIDLLSALYFHEMKHNPKNPEWQERDRFILSKGHGAPAQYVCLAHAGYFPKEELNHLRQINSMLQGHPDRVKIPGIEISTGSLGMGLSVGNGMAYAGKMDGLPYQTFVVMGDGELQEGQCWEALWTTTFLGLGNVTVIIDRNGLQNDGWVKETKDPEPLAAKLEAFGFETITINGHDFREIIPALQKSRSAQKPLAIIAKTVKGKGVPFMENNPDFHGKALSPEQLTEALKGLER